MTLIKIERIQDFPEISFNISEKHAKSLIDLLFAIEVYDETKEED